MSLDAIIFDMDGVISETQRLHAEAQSRILEQYGTEMPPEEITKKYAGKPPGTLFREESSADPEKAHSEKQELLHKLVEEKGIEPVEGSIQLIEKLSSDYKLAVASSSKPEFIRKVLNNLGLESHFNVIKSASEVEDGKPAPDVFLEAARDMEVSPENCLVIEDGRSGMKGAKEAGMSCLGLVSEPGDYPADRTVRSLTNVDIDYLESLHRDFNQEK